MQEINYKEVEIIKQSIIGKIKRHFGKNFDEATLSQKYKACAMTARDEIMNKWTTSAERIEKSHPKILYYLSVEFLMGRFLGNNIMNLQKQDLFIEALKELGLDYKKLQEEEVDAGLGNGGLGRLAACFLDSATTLNMPVVGCGIRYEYGLFKQKIVDGYQVEIPDPWLEEGNIWEIARPEEQEEVRFGGKIKQYWEHDRMYIQHTGYKSIIAIPYDIPVTGYGSNIVNTLRLWSARSAQYLNFDYFNRGDYLKATEEKELAEVISQVLYPEDNHIEGRILRLKQYYFFVSAAIQSIIKKNKKYSDLRALSDNIVIQINDTHPALAIPEMMRVLMDQEGFDWDTAWNITTHTFAYTNHTIMQEALEKWPVSLFSELLPRIYQILQEINDRYCRELWNYYPGQWQKISHMAVISYDQIWMANLCMAACFAVNGVSALHTSILKKQTFAHEYNIHPDRFIGITNGITHRRWLLHANPRLASLITQKTGGSWIMNPEKLTEIEKLKDDAGFQQDFYNIKKSNKEDLAEYIMAHNGIKIDTSSVFDVQAKRMHEYKRQLLNALRILYDYNRLLDNPNDNMIPRTYIFAAKASPGYYRAKLTIKLINSIAYKVNNDPLVKDRIKVVFLEDYGVSLAEKIIPAADVSEQISTAGKEASGTGNMKFMLNGAVTVGTLDGSNIEIKNAVGPDNIYIFGLHAADAERYSQYGGYYSHSIYDRNVMLKRVLDELINGFLDKQNPSVFQELYRSLLFSNGSMADQYYVLMDFEPFINIQEKVSLDFTNKREWTKKAIVNTARAGIFSSDICIRKYNKLIWHLSPIKNA